jgi:hypothetical protein
MVLCLLMPQLLPLSTQVNTYIVGVWKEYNLFTPLVRKEIETNPSTILGVDFIFKRALF